MRQWRIGERIWEDSGKQDLLRHQFRPRSSRAVSKVAETGWKLSDWRERGEYLCSPGLATSLSLNPTVNSRPVNGEWP